MNLTRSGSDEDEAYTVKSSVNKSPLNIPKLLGKSLTYMGNYNELKTDP